ncbi:MAG: response regulator [Solobacterium sp.]|nr:response regulator [Solobacterium sp.]MCH4222799.1 response regulator [Solobacterium sp.]MCH4265419.1 response regulator [Solobacterium sp.]
MDSEKRILRELDINLLDSLMASGFIVTGLYPGYPIIYANDLFVEMLGYDSLEDLKTALGNNAIAFVAPEDMDLIQHEAAKRTGSEAYEITYRIVRKDGARVAISQRSRHKTLSDGTEVILASYINLDRYQDFNRTRREHMKLEMEHDSIKRIVSSIPIGINVYHCVNGKSELLTSNPACNLLLTGSEEPTDEDIEKQIQSRVHPNDCSIVRKTIERLKKGSQIEQCIFRTLAIDQDSYAWIMMNAKSLMQKDGSMEICCSYTDITSKVESQQHASYMENKLYTAMSNIHVAVWEYFFKERKNYYTADTVRHFNIPSVMDNIPNSLIDSGQVYPGSVATVRRLYEAMDRGEPSAEGEVELKSETDGKSLWMKVHMTALYQNGVSVSAICTGEDITREKTLLLKMEDEITRRTSVESSLRGKGYYDLSDDHIIEYDTRRLVSNPLNRLLSYKDAVAAVARQIPDERESIGFKQLFNPQKLIQLFNQGSTELSYEYRRMTPEHTISWVETSIHLTRQPSNDHIVAFMYTVDINEARQAQEIINAITTDEYDYITLINAENSSYRVYSHNENDHTVFAESGENFWQNFIPFLKKYMAKDELDQALKEESRDSVLSRLQAQNRCIFTRTLIKEDGTSAIKRVTFSWLNSSHSDILLTSADITEAMKKEKQQKEILADALNAAKQASIAKSNFLSQMSHEIRTPMNAILGMSTLAAQNIGNDEALMDCISKIGISGHYLLSLINSILDMSRIESGKMLLNTAPFNFAEFIDSVNSVVFGQIQAKGIQYETIVAHGLEDGYIGDTMKLQQILVNILGNAIKFTPAGGRITLSISQGSRDGKYTRIRFACNDTGCGISEEAQKRIFEPFEQADNSNTSVYGGTGLGLPIAKSLAELMGGTIRVRSIVGVGSEFTVEIPLEIDPAVVKPHVKYSFQDLSTLVVDDDLMVCEQTAETLKDIGMIPEYVTSGKDAVKRVSEVMRCGKPFDFVLVDWKMPDMDGIETAREIRHIVGPEVTIIIITAYDWASIEQKAKAAGVNLCISKPMFKSTLVSAFTRATSDVERQKISEQEPEIDFTGKRVLLAEDNALNCEIAKALLEHKHCAVDTAKNGLEALQMFTASKVGYYQAILMDIRMPIMDGLQSCNSIRHWERPDAKTIPIIAMTANAFDEDIEKSKAAGMDAHLSKPVDTNLLYSVLYRLIQSSEVIPAKK